MTKVLSLAALVAVAVWGAASIQAADVYGLEKGTLELQSIGPIAFGPDGILLVGDNKGAALYAVRTGDQTGDANESSFEIGDLNAALEKALGSKAIEVQDLAVNPLSGNLYLALHVDGRPALVKIEGNDRITQVMLTNIPFAKVELPAAPEDKPGERRNPRASAITDIAFADGHVLLTGMAAADAPSSIRSIQFPFSDEKGMRSSLEIYHAAHGAVETGAPARTIVPIMIGGEPTVLAGYVCTPLVKFSLKELSDGEKVRGTTVAELGNRNMPLDMISYKKGGKDFLLLSNSARGVMKISTENIDRKEGLEEPVRGGGVAGQKYETIESLAGTVQLDMLNDAHAVVLIKGDGNLLALKTVDLP